MSSLVISGDTSGTVTVAAPAVAGSNTLTLLAATATNSVNVLSTAVASTSGTSIDFTSIPSWVKRITVIFIGVSTSATSPVQVQLGAGSVTTSGYISQSTFSGSGSATSSVTSGLHFHGGTAASARNGAMTIMLLGSNSWSATWMSGQPADSGVTYGGGSITLSGTLDRVRITTVNGTDTFDAGSINILYEG